MNNKKIAHLLDVIKERGLDVAKFSAQSGVSADRVYAWKAGKGSPKADDTRKIEQWLGYSLDNIGKSSDSQIFKHLSAKVEILMTSMAEMISATNGENVAVVRKKLDKAVADLEKI